MKRLIFIPLACLLLLQAPLSAQEIVSNTNLTEQNAELRLSAAYSHAFNYGLGLSLEEEIRTRLGGYVACCFHTLAYLISH